jgi:phosphoglycolate phosphatase
MRTCQLLQGSPLVISPALAETALSYRPESPLSAANNDLGGATIAFDLDGCLVDTAPDLVGTLNLILAENGHHGLPLEAARTVVGHGARAMLLRGFEAVGETLGPEQINHLFDRFIELYRRRIDMASRPYPGVVEVLDDFAAAGAKLVVCTNKRTDLSLALLDALDLTRRFVAVVGPDKAGAAKPDPHHLLFAIQAAGGSAERALMIGDSSSDVGAASAAGVPVVAVSFGYSDIAPADLGADAVIDSFAELPPIARRLLAGRRAAIRPVLPDQADA